ncbi:HlyD family type I secretion periplasmic adaptor subunit [Propionivibrio dicarboxylicus]|uniref:Membrane fusion protein (MFP) family protein n=1 Tax=Propionivibrio dicarboxylicus TaxID=83767 RepID=A0A1G8GBX3_9RHOO|nr:HlyD family type I secretion periplasmic adaptor subunit [Propionivibrio dicarboxylicus]SDH91857.1 hemolysin D [Propionivibrio dicarboxylicus]
MSELTANALSMITGLLKRGVSPFLHGGRVRVFLSAFGDLLARYSAIFKETWRVRDSLGGERFTPFEAQFLPAALSLQETPPSPAPRIAMRLIIAFGLLAIVWSVVGKLEIVATAQGKILLREGTKAIQPIETSVVRAIHVLEGAKVQRGQVLVELDTTSTGADLARTASDLLSARLQLAKAEALQKAIAKGVLPPLSIKGAVPHERLNEVTLQTEGQFAEFKAKLTRSESEIARREAELITTAAIINKLEQTSPLVNKRASDFGQLVQQGFVSQHSFLEKEQSRIELEGDLESQRSRLRETQASLSETRWQRANIIAEFRRTVLDSATEQIQKIAALEQEYLKADNKNHLMRLVAPVDGQVQQLAVHTVGGVVTPAQVLMNIVPPDREIEVEAMVENRDIGFVRVDQLAEVKFDTFLYTKYGTVPAHVVSVSRDAIADEKKGLLFSSRIRLDRSFIDVDGVQVGFTPGMSVVVEIKTGMRRVIEYFLSPLLQYKRESLRER